MLKKARGQVAFTVELRRWEQERGEERATHEQCARRFGINGAGCGQGGGIGEVRQRCGGEVVALAQACRVALRGVASASKGPWCVGAGVGVR